MSEATETSADQQNIPSQSLDASPAPQESAPSASISSITTDGNKSSERKADKSSYLPRIGPPESFRQRRRLLSGSRSSESSGDNTSPCPDRSDDSPDQPKRPTVHLSQPRLVSKTLTERAKTSSARLADVLKNPPRFLQSPRSRPTQEPRIIPFTCEPQATPTQEPQEIPVQVSKAIPAHELKAAATQESKTTSSLEATVTRAELHSRDATRSQNDQPHVPKTHSSSYQIITRHLQHIGSLNNDGTETTGSIDNVDHKESLDDISHKESSSTLNGGQSGDESTTPHFAISHSVGSKDPSLEGSLLETEPPPEGKTVLFEHNAWDESPKPDVKYTHAVHGRTMSVSDMPETESHFEGKPAGPSARSQSVSGEEIAITKSSSPSPSSKLYSKSTRSLDMSGGYTPRRLRRQAPTDLDQAMKYSDEEKLRRWFGDSTPVKKEQPVESVGNVSEDSVQETNLDDVPLETLFLNLNLGEKQPTPLLVYDSKTPVKSPRNDENDISSSTSTNEEEPLKTGVDADAGSVSKPGIVSEADIVQNVSKVTNSISNEQQYRPKVNLEDAVVYPENVPENLNFTSKCVFEGQMLLKWLGSWYSDAHYLHMVLTKHDLRVLVTQFCTHLLSAGVILHLEQQEQGTAFKAHLMYYWARPEALPSGQGDLAPGKLTSMWPLPQLESEHRPGDKYTEAEHQAAMVQLRLEYKENLEKLEKEHEEELEKCRLEYMKKITECTERIVRLQQEVQKYQVLAGIDELTQNAINQANAAGQEAGFDSECRPLLSNSHTGERIIALTGTPSNQYASYSATSSVTPELLGKDAQINLCQTEFSPENFPCIYPPLELLPSPEQQNGHSPLPDGYKNSVDAQPPPASPPPFSLEGAAPPPPAPPPPPSGPPVPPPPPGFGFAMLAPGFARRGPCKPVISPKSPMKPLFWQRFHLHDIKLKDKELQEHHLFWEDIEEAKVNLDEFDDLFSKVPVEKKKKATANKSKTKTKQGAKIIDAKRSQAVGIMVSSLRLEMTDIENAILNLDTSVLEQEKMKAIYENRPTDDEMKKINSYISKHSDALLDKPEQFLYDLNQIPDYADRIFCFIFQSTFQENISTIKSKLNNIKMTSKVLTSGSGVKMIFSLILTLGNYMNGGSRTRGQADGFGLEILPKLKDVKGKDNRTSLLQYITMQYVLKFEKDDAGTDRVKLPFPDPSDIKQAALVSFDDITKELRRIRTDFNSAELRADKVLNSQTSLKHQQPFRDQMTGFFSTGRQEFEEQEENLKECQNRFYEAVKCFCVKPKSGDPAVTPEYFFGFWSTFCSDFKDLWKNEQQRIIKQRLKKAQTHVKKIMQSKKTSTVASRPIKPGGLKDKMQRMEARYN